MDKFLHIFLSILILTACSKKTTLPKSHQPVVEINATTPKRIADLSKIVIALDRYKLAHRGYPISHDGGKLWSKYINEKGVKNLNWIAGLHPEFIDALPHETESQNYKKQYVYKSDGANYKILSLRPSDFNSVAEIYPSLIDKSRKYEAYGYWTAKAAEW
jgi:hypothetical protein